MANFMDLAAVTYGEQLGIIIDHPLIIGST